MKLQSYVQTSLKQHFNKKLSPRYYGPYLIVARIGKVAYKLDLPATSQIHPTFHVSLLKAAHGALTPTLPLPNEPRFTLQPRAILDKQVVKKGDRIKVQVFVHWQGIPATEATWEDQEEFVLRFPSFNS